MNTELYRAYLPFYLILSTVFGSFLNMLVWRVPRRESLAGRSHCFSCGHILAGKDLIPIVSWLWLQGKCRYCGVQIPFRYLWLEVSMLITWTICWMVAQNPSQLFWACLGTTLFLFLVALFRSWPRKK